MEYSRFNFLGFAHVPEILAKVAASTAGYVHLSLILVVADGAFPFVVVVYYNFSVEAANVAIVRFGVKFGVLDIIVYKTHNVFHSRKVLAHIGNFDIRYCSARRNLLELAFESEFCESVDMFTQVYVIAFCVIALVR